MLPKEPIDPEEAHVLIVEDHIQSAVLLSRMLDFIGVHRYERNASRCHTLELAKTMSKLDLVLMDLYLPDGSGFDALDELRNNPRFVHTCVVAVTSDNNLATMEKARTAGFDGFLAKPIDLDKFPEQITDILHGKAIWDVGDEISLV